MTKPTKAQEQARDRLVQALLLITEAVKLDGKTALGASEWAGLASKIAGLSSAFSLDQIVERALEHRGKALNLRAGTGELLMLVEGEIPPLQGLMKTDQAFREWVRAAEEALGDL